MPNIKFNYLYRDSSNYKKHNSVIFSNPTNVELSDLETLIKLRLIDGEWFYAENWNVPELFLDTLNYITDPTWHEFESIRHTDQSANSSVEIEEFIETLKTFSL